MLGDIFQRGRKRNIVPSNVLFDVITGYSAFIDIDFYCAGGIGDTRNEVI